MSNSELDVLGIVGCRDNNARRFARVRKQLKTSIGLNPQTPMGTQVHTKWLWCKINLVVVATTHFKKLTTRKTCLLSQLLL